MSVTEREGHDRAKVGRMELSGLRRSATEWTGVVSARGSKVDDVQRAESSQTLLCRRQTDHAFQY